MFLKKNITGTTMTILKTMFILISLTLLSSCASISKEDCSKNMQSLGLEQGKSGKANQLDDVRKVCDSEHHTIDLEGYQRGYEMGINQYCTPLNGFLIGANGDSYKKICPEEYQGLFHEKYLIGKKVFEKKDQLLELEEKIKDITAEADKSASQFEELKMLKEDHRQLQNEIQRLERDGKSPKHTD